MGHAFAPSGRAVGGARLDDIGLLLPFMDGIPRPAALCEALLDRFGSLAGVVHAPPEEVRAADPALAPFARRLAAVRALHAALLRVPLATAPRLPSPRFRTPDDVARHLAARERPADVERLGALLLDVRLRLVEDVDLGAAAGDRTSAYPRKLARLVLDRNAAGVVLHQGRPGADPSPSPADWDLTDRIRDALGCIDAPLYDHFLVAGAVAVSMARRQPWRFDRGPKTTVHAAARP